MVCIQEMVLLLDAELLFGKTWVYGGLHPHWIHRRENSLRILCLNLRGSIRASTEMKMNSIDP